jgi:hypothetical protein
MVWDFENIPLKVPLKRDCDSTKLKWSKKSDWEEPDDERKIAKLESFYCIDTTDMSIYGDHSWCQEGCGYYKITIKQRTDTERARCPKDKKLILDNVLVSMVMMDNYLNLEDYNYPWSIHEKTENSILDTTLQQNMFIWFQEKKLVTQSHGTGFLDEPKTESRLSFNSMSYKYETVPTILSDRINLR